MYVIIYCKKIYLLFLNQPISSRSKEKTNILVCAAFIMKKQPFILEKGVLFC